LPASVAPTDAPKATPLALAGHSGPTHQNGTADVESENKPLLRLGRRFDTADQSSGKTGPKTADSKLKVPKRRPRERESGTGALNGEGNGVSRRMPYQSGPVAIFLPYYGGGV
jgi:hypothetical protein